MSEDQNLPHVGNNPLKIVKIGELFLCPTPIILPWLRGIETINKYQTNELSIKVNLCMQMLCVIRSDYRQPRHLNYREKLVESFSVMVDASLCHLDTLFS